jgi:hypothetical protein
MVIIAMLWSILLGLAGRAGAAPQTLYVQPNAAKVRENPELETENVLDVIPQGTPLKAFEPEGNWYPVQLLDGRTGWMHESVLGPKPSGTPRPASASASRLPVVRIGIVQDGVPSGDDVAAVFEKEIRDLLAGEYTIRFPAAMRLQADWSMARVKAAMDRLLASQQIDMILALGVFASHDAAHRRLTKPVFAPFVINPQLQEIPLQDGASGVRYLSYVTFPSNIVRDLRVFLDIVRFNKFAFLVAEGITESLPQLPRSVQNSVEDLGLEVTIVPVGTTADSALAALTDDIEAVYVAPLQQLVPGEFQRLAEGLIARRLPSFSFWGRSEVERGLLLSLARDTNISRLARRVALNVQRTLLGEDPGTFPVTFSRGERMTFNMATARAMQFSPPWGFLTQMDVLYGEPAGLPRQLSLAQAVREAVQANLDVQAADRFVAAGQETIHEARGELLPQVTAVARGRIIDADRANIGAPERTVTGSLELLQLLYSEPTWANLSIQRSLQSSREKERQITLLDVVLDATTSYLNVLSSKTAERIRRDNLNLTRTNLELAQVRRSVGVARPNEVLRWESQIANDRRDVINVFAQRQQAEIGLNRVLHRPLEEPFTTEEPSLDDPQLLTNFARILPYVDNPRYFAIFREFMVQEGLEAAPELQQAGAEIAAQERVSGNVGHIHHQQGPHTIGNLPETDKVKNARVGTGSGHN